MSRAEAERKRVIDIPNPLIRHSLNQSQLKKEIQGEIRVYGMSIRRLARRVRKEETKKRTRQVVYDSVTNIFSGDFSEEDILNVVLLSDDIEKRGGHNASVIDFTGLRPSKEQLGEPSESFFRKKR